MLGLCAPNLVKTRQEERKKTMDAKTKENGETMPDGANHSFVFLSLHPLFSFIILVLF